MLCIVCDKQQDIPETERRTMGIEIYFTGMLKQAVGALVLSPAYKGVEEIRLRVNRPVRILREGKIYFLGTAGELKKQPERIERAKKELGLENAGQAKGGAVGVAEKSVAGSVKKFAAGGKTAPCGEFLKRRLEREINLLYERIAGALREENARLKEENERLKRLLTIKR